jgi:hypothetical protein
MNFWDNLVSTWVVLYGNNAHILAKPKTKSNPRKKAPIINTTTTLPHKQQQQK